jgi:segregation and condensation protein A
VVSFVAVLELIKRQLIGVVMTSTDSNVSPKTTTNGNQLATDSQLEQLTLQWLV